MSHRFGGANHGNTSFEMGEKMYHYKCTQPGCGETECQPLPNTRVWCKCTVRKRVKGDGTRSFHPEMMRVSVIDRRAAAA